MSDHPTKSIGKGMFFLAWLLVLGLLYLLFGDILEKQYNPNRQLESRVTGEVIEVRLEQNRFGHYVSSGKINGHDVTFLLDTGATRISIPEPTARRLGLERGYEHQVNTANGVITVYGTRLRELQLGAITMHDLSASINPHMNDDSILLGMNALKQLDMIQRSNVLTLRQHR